MLLKEKNLICIESSIYWWIIFLPVLHKPHPTKKPKQKKSEGSLVSHIADEIRGVNDWIRPPHDNSMTHLLPHSYIIVLSCRSVRVNNNGCCAFHGVYYDKLQSRTRRYRGFYIGKLSLRPCERAKVASEVPEKNFRYRTAIKIF